MNERCAMCGERLHRYGVGDPNHRPQPIACVNTLTAVRDHYRSALREIASDRMSLLPASYLRALAAKALEDDRGTAKEGLPSDG